LWAGTLDEFFGGDAALGPSIASQVSRALIIPVLVTTMHVHAVQDLAAGRAPSFRRSTIAAFRMAPTVSVVVVLYLLVTTAGFLLLIPGIWLSVRLYFGAQAAVVEGTRGRDALHVSSRYVDADWGRAFGTLLVIGLVAFVLGAAVGIVLGGPVALITDSGIAIGVANIASSAVAYSLSALLATIFFFDLRTRDAKRTRRARSEPVPNA